MALSLRHSRKQELEQNASTNTDTGQHTKAHSTWNRTQGVDSKAGEMSGPDMMIRNLQREVRA